MNQLLIVCIWVLLLCLSFFSFLEFLSSPIKSSFHPPALGGWWLKTTPSKIIVKNHKVKYLNDEVSTSIVNIFQSTYC